MSRLRGAAAWALVGLLAWGALARAQDASAPRDTLNKARTTGAVTIGYRDSAIPFSFVSARGEPIGYSIDLCTLLVDAIAQAVDRPVETRWRAVTSQSRLEALESGQIDLECGSTTHNLEREKRVGFSPTFFISGTKLLVPRGSAIRSFRDLAGKRVGVTAGTTNERAVRDLAAKFKLDLTLVESADHEASFARLTSGQLDAFATDDVLLYGLLAQHRASADYEVVGEFLSYDPYAIALPKGDADLARLVDDTFAQLARDGEIERRYKRWFERTLPSGVSLNLPMSAQLVTLIQTLVPRGD